MSSEVDVEMPGVCARFGSTDPKMGNAGGLLGSVLRNTTAEGVRKAGGSRGRSSSVMQL